MKVMTFALSPNSSHDPRCSAGRLRRHAAVLRRTPLLPCEWQMETHESLTRLSHHRGMAIGSLVRT